MHLLLLICLVTFCIMAILLRDLLKSAICLAIASIFLAILFFRMNSPYIGVFEISVVAGLITILFISTITLVRSQGKDAKESKWPLILFPLFFILFIIIDIIIVNKLVGKVPAISNPDQGTMGQVLWNNRIFDLIGQMGIIFAGVFAVLSLFRNRSRHE